MKRVLALTLILEFSLIVIILYSLEKFDTIRTTYRQLGSFHGPFPSSEPRWTEEGNWKGYAFKEGLGLFFQTHENPAKRLEEIINFNFRGNRLSIHYVPLGDSAFIAFKPMRKGYVVTSVISLDTLVLWVSLDSKGSTLDNRFQYFVNFLGSLKYQDHRVARAGFQQAIRNFRKGIAPFLLQSKETFFALIFGILLLANVLTFSALLMGGACPKIPGDDWEIVTPGVMVYEKLPLGQRSYSACLVKRGTEILIVVFRKVRKTLYIEQIRDNLRFRGKTLIIGDSLRFELPDEEALSRWQAIL